jgi:hypothetical protein
MTATSCSLAQVFCDAFAVSESFLSDLDAANLPAVTEEEACIFAEGNPEAIAALLASKPHLQPVEDFLGGYAF